MVTRRLDAAGEGWHDAQVDGLRTAARSTRPPRSCTTRQEIFEGHEGLPARRRLGLDLPPGGQRGAVRAQRAPAGAARAARGTTSSSRSRRWSRPTSTGCPSRRRRRRASTCGRSCSPPRSFLGVRPAAEVTYCVIASPAGAYFPGGVKPVSIWISTDYARAGAGGTGAAKCGGNYAASLAGADGGRRARLRPGRVPRRRRAHVHRGARRDEPVLRHARRPDRHARADRLDPRGRHPRPRSSSWPRSSASSRRSAGSRSRSGRTGPTSGELRRGLRLRHRRRHHAGRRAEVGSGGSVDHRRGGHEDTVALACGSGSSTSSTAGARTPTAG